MKFKSFLLGMLGAAAIVSCNNDEINDGKGKGPGEVVEGLPLYATLDLRINDGAKTYAGGSDVGALDAEKVVKNALIYIYKFDGINTTPENIVYVTVSNFTGTGNGTTTQNGNQVTLRSTSGRKKVYVALNVEAGSLNLLPKTSKGGTANGVSDELPAGQTFAVVNNPIYAGQSAASLSPSTSTTVLALAQEKADVLNTALSTLPIKSTNQGSGLTAGGYAGTNGMLMTNWSDGDDNATGSATSHPATCEFILTADVDSTTSWTGGVPNNNLAISVQHAFAKISLDITAVVSPLTITATTDYSNKAYVAAAGEGHEGVFIPWTASGTTVSGAPVWSIGNIAKFTTPFQQYVSKKVRDYYYNNQDDSLTTGKMVEYMKHYDNTRIYGTSATLYPKPIGNGATVTSTKGAMTTANNWIELNASPSTTTSARYYAHVPENAREQPTEEFLTAVIIGGKYRPKTIITNVDRKNMVGQGADLYYNGSTMLGTPGPDYFEPASIDTLYYLADEGVFIAGSNQVKRYYAWVRNGGYEPSADKTNPVFTAATTGPINADIVAKNIYAFFNSQCFYRIFIKQSDTQAEVSRNHIYAVNLTEFKGPGMSDPNDFFTPGKPVTAAATFVTAEISILDWHKVDQPVIAGNQ